MVSARLSSILDALPLWDGARILEIGCGSGSMAREMVTRVAKGYVLALDRSEKSIATAIAGSAAELATGRLSFRRVAIEEFELRSDETRFDIAVAVRVGVLDGRHPGRFEPARRRIRAALVPGGKLFIDGGTPLQEIDLAALK